MKINPLALASLFFSSVFSVNSLADSGDQRTATQTIPADILKSLEQQTPGSAAQWIKDVELRARGKVHVTTHEETNAVDLTCFDCDVIEFAAAAVLDHPTNED